jgi:hypothetical protein
MTSGFPGPRLGSSATDQASGPILSKPYRKEKLRRMVREVIDGPPHIASSTKPDEI